MKPNSSPSRILLSRTLLAMTALSALSVGCAKDRTLDDYRREQVEQEIAEMNAVRGDYRGMYSAASGADAAHSGDGGLIGGLAIRIQPDRQAISGPPSGGGGSANGGGGGDVAQRAVLKITVTLLGATTKSLTFTGGSYDRSAKAFQASATVEGRGTAQISGTFDGDRIMGTLEAEGYPDRGGSFSLTRNSGAPALAGIRTRASTEERFLFNSFGGMGKFRKGPPAWVNMMILRRASSSEQDLMDVITPYRRVDVSLFFNTPILGPDGKPTGDYRQAGGVFSDVIWDIRSRTLTGNFNAPAGQGLPPTLLKLQCQEIGEAGRPDTVGWQCTEYALTNAIGEVFSADFRPGAQPPETLTAQ